MPMLWRVLICAGRPAPPPPASRRRYKRDHGTAPIARASPWDFPRTARWAASPTPGTSPPLSRLAEWTVDAYCHNETYGKSRWRSAMAGAVGRRRSSWRKDGRVEEPPQRLAPRGRPAPLEGVDRLYTRLLAKTSSKTFGLQGIAQTGRPRPWRSSDARVSKIFTIHRTPQGRGHTTNRADQGLRPLGIMIAARWCPHALGFPDPEDSRRLICPFTA